MKKNLRYWFIVALSLVMCMPAMAGFDDGMGTDIGGNDEAGELVSDVIGGDYPYSLYYNFVNSMAGTVSVVGVKLEDSTATLETLFIPQTLTQYNHTLTVVKVEDLSFRGQENVTDVTLEEGIEIIGSNAFRYLNKLQYLQIPKTVNLIEEGAFDYCDSLDNVYWNVPDYKATTNAYGPFYNVREHISNITFGEDVRVIPPYLCYGMTRLGGFESGSDSIRVVRAHAFEGCTSMYWFPFYEGLDTIETKAFMGCTGLSQGMSIMASLQYVGDSAFANCTDLMSVDFNGNPDIYGRGVFAGCTSVESVTFPSTWDHIPDYVCENMTGLKSFTQLMDYSGETIAQTPITSIGQYAFAGCSSLERALIPDSVRVIGFRAFKDCYTISSLTIPANVTTIGAEAFWDCIGLKSITSDALTPPTVADNTFLGVPATIPVIVPSGSVNAYRQAAGWSRFYQIMTVNSPNGICGENLMWMFSYEDSTLYITGTGAMYNYGSSDATGATGSDGSVGAMAPWFENDLNGQIYHVSLPTGLTSIGDYAFYSCSNLQEVDVPEWVTTIGDYAFQDCAQMKSCKLHYNLTSIGAYAFNQCMSLDSINLPVTLGSLGEAAFQSCESLRFVEVPEGITSIPKNAFYACKNLNQVNLPTALLTIGEFAFNACSALPGITIPDKVTSIGDNAFEYCDNLTFIALPDSLQTIGGMAFYDCPLALVDLPAKLTNIGYGAFMNCSTITEVYCYAKTPPTVEYAVGSTDQPVAFPDIASTTPVYVPVQSLLTYKYRTGWKTHNLIAMNLGGTCGDNLTWLLDFSDSTFTITGSGAMTDYANDQGRPWVLYDDNNMPDDYSTAVKTLILPEGMTSIGKNAFRFFNKITEVTIPSTVTTIGESAFGACYLLASVTIPDNVTTIGSSVFSNNRALTSIHIGSGVTSIGTSTFNSAPLTTMTVDSRNTTYDSRDNCNAIIKTASNELAFGCKTTVIPNTVTTIASFAFSYCSGLTSITIPASVKTINGYAFSQCTNLAEITSEALTPPTLVSSSFYSVSDTIPVYVPARGYRAYQADANWSKFTNMIALPCDTTFHTEESLTVLTADLPYVWNGRELTESTTLVDTLQTADGCDSIVTLNLTVLPGGMCGDSLSWMLNTAEGVLMISGSGAMTNYSGQNAPWYEYRASISSLSLPEGLTTIGDAAFFDCTALRQVTIPGTVSGIGVNAFWDCKYLRTVSMSEGITTIGEQAFAYCSMLTTVSIPASVTSIGASAFYGCQQLNKIQVASDNTQYATYLGVLYDKNITRLICYPSAYEGVSGLYSVPNTVTGIESHAFADCAALTELVLPASLTSIGSEAFTNCENVTSITCRAITPPTCGDSAFDGININTNVSVPYRSVAAYKEADGWQKFRQYIQAIPCTETLRSTETVTIAETQLPYIWHDFELTASGSVDDSLRSIDNCDSVVTLNLTVLPVERVTESDTVCYVELPFMWRGRQLVVSGTYFDTVRTAHTGLDSIIYSNHFMAYLPVEASTESATICEGEKYEWHGRLLTEAGQYNDTVLNADGCDSVCYLMLRVNPAYHFRENAVTCEGEAFEWHGRPLQTAGVYYDSLQTIYGCDSIYELTLTVYRSYLMVAEPSICQGETYEWHGRSLTEEGIYHDTLTSIHGCDSVCTVMLHVRPVYYYEDSAMICDGNSYEWHGMTYRQTGVYTDSLQTIHGCDSIWTLRLTVNPTFFFEEEAVTCEGNLYEWHGRYLENAGIYYDSLYTVNGCDSIYRLTLSVNPMYFVYDTAYICEGDVYEWNGLNCTDEMRYTANLHTVNDCDSFCYLQLFHYPTYFFEETEVRCENEPFEWHGRSIKTSGTYYDSLQTVHGCDSIYKLVITYNPTYFFPETHTICQGETYLWHGYEYTESGIYYDSLNSHLTCDSVYELTLTVNPTYLFRDTAWLCENIGYTWRGHTYRQGGTYYDSLLTTNGCDSVYSITLTTDLPSGTCGAQGDNLTWVLDCDSVLTISGSGAMTDYGYHTAPWFKYEDKIKTIVFEEGVTTVGVYAFGYFSYIQEAIFPSTLKTIKNSAFYQSSLQKPIYLPSGVTAIEDRAFGYCAQIPQITCEANIPPTAGEQTFFNIPASIPVYVPARRIALYRAADEWRDFTNFIALPCDTTFTAEETATICDGTAYEWHGQTYMQAGMYIDTLTNVDGCDSVCTLRLTVNPTYAFSDEATICEGTEYEWHGQTYRLAGIYTDSLQTVNGCDSIWTLTLTVNPAYNVTETATICQGETYTWHSKAYSEAGQYIDTLPTMKGCDSICTLLLTVNPTYAFSDEATICEGTSYNWHGQTYRLAGVYTDSLQTVNGCDSIWTLNLTVNPAYNVSETATICQGETYTWHSKEYNVAGQYIDTLPTMKGCDSICTLMLTVNPTYAFSDEATICEGTEYEWHGQTYRQAGVYADSLQTVNGCDSIWTLNLTVNPAYNVSETATICQGETYTWHSKEYNVAGQYIDTLPTMKGCDSICTLLLTVNPTYAFSDKATICEGETYTWHNAVYTEAGEYVDTLHTINGCDSICTLMLTVHPAYNVTDEATICEGETYTWHEANYTEAGEYIDTLHTINGCDSVCTLLLTVNPAYSMTDEATICDGDSYEWHGMTYRQAGVYTDSLQSIHGCDSIWTLTLTVLTAMDVAATDTIVCEAELPIMWHGMTLTATGTYYDTLRSVFGCDSLRYTLNLTALVAVDMPVENRNVCEGDLPYTWRGMTITAAGTYHDTLRYQGTGCDSERYTLNLTVSTATTQPMEEIEVCEKELPVIWQGRSLTAAGIYYDTVRNIYGCDSICRSLNLIVNHEQISTEQGVICEGETFTWHNRQLTKQSIYYDTLQTISGCDSICILNLTVHPSYLIEEIVSIREDKLPYKWQGRNITEAGNYVAEYESVHGCDSIITLQLMVTALPIYSVNVLADHGHVNGTGTYPEGTHITLTAVPDEGFEFQMWSDGTTENPKEFTVMQDTTFRALFFMPEVEQDVTVDSIETNSVTIIWDTVPGAVLYELRIYKNGELVVTYEVDPDNNIVGEHHIGPDRIVARKDSTGGSSETLQVSVGGLDSGQDYTYSLDALDDDRSFVGAQSGSFTTEAEEPEGLDTLFDKQHQTGARKLLIDGHLYIELPDGTRYSPEGALLE